MYIDSLMSVVLADALATPSVFLDFAAPASIVFPFAEVFVDFLTALEVALEGGVTCIQWLGLDEGEHLCLRGSHHHWLHHGLLHHHLWLRGHANRWLYYGLAVSHF